MTRPLHKGLLEPCQQRPVDGHTGLWFDKYCNTWNNGFKQIDKSKWIQTVASRQDRVGNREQIDERVRRTLALVACLGGKYFVFKNTSRFVTGLGRSHPTENGFAWHPTLGAPYLPGSSIKGMVRAWAREEMEGVCFLDAFPLVPVQLEADIMTPHYANWTTEEPPGDWRSPTPIPFLTVAPGTAFFFGALPQAGKIKFHLDNLDEWLGAALLDAGAGAKTSVGYGRFVRDEELEKSLDPKPPTAVESEGGQGPFTPVQREIRQILNDHPNKLEPATTKIFVAIQNGRWTGADRFEAAEWLKRRMIVDKKWKERVKSKNPDRDKDFKRTKQVQVWLEQGGNE